MPRKPGVYLKDGYWRTSIGGVQHQKLCKEEEGKKQALLSLARLQVARDDAQKSGTVTASPGPGIPLVFSPAQLTANAVTVLQVYDDFLNSKKVEADESTYLGYRDCLDPFGEMFAGRTLCSITYEDGLRYKEWLRHEKPWIKGKVKMKGVGPARVNKCMRVAKTLFNWARKPSRQGRYGLTMNPWEEIKYDVEKPRERLITTDEFTHLLAECDDGNISGGDEDFREQLTVLRYTTMRPGELRKLQWDYIQWEQNRIVFPPSAIKTRKRREVTMIDAVKHTLLKRKERAESKSIKATGFVFPKPATTKHKRHAIEAGPNMQKGHSLTQRFRRLFERCVGKGLIEREKAGERIVLYNTRHTRITELFVQGNEHHIVMFDAGHVVPATTERYKHLAGSFVAKSIRSKGESASDGGS